MFPFTEEKIKWDDYGEMIRYSSPHTCIFRMVSSLNDPSTLLSLRYIEIIRLISVYPTNKRHWPKGSMHRVCWVSIYIDRCIYIYIFSPTFGQCLGNVYVVSLTMSQNCTSFEISVYSCVQYFPVLFLHFARLQLHFVWIIGLVLTVCLLG